MLELHEAIAIHRESILRLATLHGVERVHVFGSMARGDAGPDSDVDLLVDVAEGVSGLALGALVMDLQDVLGRRVDLVVARALHPMIRDRVLAEALLL
jgi:hypothetical protein